MKTTTSLLSVLALLLSLLLSLPSGAQTLVPIAVPPDVLADYHKLLKHKARNQEAAVSLSDFSGPGSRRDVVELILVQQAFLAAGVPGMKAEFVPIANYEDTLAALAKGTVAATGTSMWLEDLFINHKDLYITTAIINRGEFEAGFYVHPDNLEAMNTLSAGDLTHLSGISSKAWKADWKTLSNLPLKDLVHVASWGDMVDAVATGRVDFLLAPFQTNIGMKLNAGGTEFVPIPQIKLGLSGSRHLAVSRKHPQGAYINAALNLGLMRLKKQGVVRQAYTDAGFFNAKVSDWKLIVAQTDSWSLTGQ